MNLAIDQLLAEDPPSKEAISTFLAEHDFPVVERQAVTFAYQGEVDGVYLQHFIYGLPTSRPFQRIEGTDFWYLVLDLPEDSRMQYKLNIVRGEDHQWILDPLNPARALDPFGANSVCQTGATERPEWTLPDAETRPGRLVKMALTSRALGADRTFRVYLPARYRETRRYPLLIVHDGRDYLRFSDLKTVLDNLIHRLEVAPLIVALTDAEERLVEYPDHEPHAHFLHDELLPFLEDHFPLLEGPGTRGLMGASFGGVASLSTAYRFPGAFGRLLLQSGSFAFTDIGQHQRGPAFDPVVDFVNRLRRDPGRISDSVFMSCGTYESLIYENRSMVPVLQGTGMNVRYVEARDGHNWENWRDRLREGLSWLFPGPLWMVYE